MGDMAELYDFMMDDVGYDDLEFYDPEVGFCRLPSGVPYSRPHSPGCTGEELVKLNLRTGEEFRGCSRYPNCRYSAPYGGAAEEFGADG